MSKRIKVILMVLVFLGLSYIIYEKIDPEIGDTLIEKTDDASVFKREYESLNGKVNLNDKEYLNVDIRENNQIKYIDIDEVIDLVEDGTGVIYLGYPECPWCRTIVPILLNSASNMSLETVYYYNPKDIRDNRVLDEEGNIVVEKEGSKEYFELVDLLSDYLLPYNELNDESIKRLYVPAIVFVRNGEIIDVHTATISSQTDPYVELTTEQEMELISILEGKINKVYEIVCDDDC